jgi:N-acyl-D-amino-acid deacylase
MISRRVFLRSAAFAAAGFAQPTTACADELPATGPADPKLAPFDQLMTSFLKEHHVPGGSLAVARHGKLVYARGFGFADAATNRPVEPVSLFRIASVSKPLTAVAVLQLVDRKKVTLDDPVLKYVRLRPHLEKGTERDPRWDKITVRHCLHHTGGWDRDKSFDPIGIPWKIADALKIQPPVAPEDVVRYMMGQPLDFDPGARFAYSNLGYLLLGRVIETASGESYESYVRTHVLAPLGVTRTRLGRALPENRAEGEVHYHDAKKATGRCLYPPRRGERVPFPDGAANFEGYEAHGGWIASAVDLVRFASAFDQPKRCPVLSETGIRTMWERSEGNVDRKANGKPRAAYYGCGWNVRQEGSGGATNTWHSGLINGTSSLLVRRLDGLNWVVLFNTDRNPGGKVLATVIDPLVHEAADEVKVWPDVNLSDRFGEGN